MADQILPELPRITDAPGGSITILRTGTADTLLTLYQDEAGTVALDNPVPIDATGNHPQIFYTEGVGAKAVLRDANGALLRVLDPCPRATATATGAGSITASPGTNNAGTTVQQQLDNNSDRIVTLTAQSYATLGAGTADDVILTSGRDLAVVPDGLTLRYRATETNTGAMTFAVDELTPVAGVTITGAAIPAGYIRTDADTVLTFDGAQWVVDRQIERGTGWTRLADGTQVVWGQQNLGAGNAAGTGALDNPYVTAAATVTWPVAFSAAPVPAWSPTVNGGGASYAERVLVANTSTPAAANTPSVRVANVVGTSVAADILLDFTAVGRWY